MAVKTLSEAARERETYKYAANQLAGLLQQKNAALIEPSKLRTSRDTVLTGLAELVALRLNATRAIISLFDQRWQYVIAEATPRLTLAPDASPNEGSELLLCGTAVPRMLSICDHVLSRQYEGSSVQGGSTAPLSVITDISHRLVDNPYFKNWPHPFYAGIPIRTPRGIEIGVLSVCGDVPRGDLDTTSAALMRDVSNTIMNHLEAMRSKSSHRRADRMVRGVGTFVEGHTTLSGWEGDPNIQSFKDVVSMPEGTLNARQQGLQRRGTVNDVKKLPSNVRNADAGVGEPDQTSVKAEATDDEGDPEMKAAQFTFSKAANILRESIEVEGVLFLDASVSSFGGGISRINRGHGSSSSSSSSSDDSRDRSPPGDTDTPCRILGFSNSSQSSIDGNCISGGHSAISEKLLKSMIKRFPLGKIFNFDGNGSPSSGGSSGEESYSSSALSASDVPNQTKTNTRSKRLGRNLLYARQNIAEHIIKIFPRARSVAFVPVWDSHKQRWFAGGFLYTQTSSRVFTPEGELSYFSAFTSIVMAEVHHGRDSLVNKTKTDLLGSLSHELRSPLHGVVLGAELLQDTGLDIFQQDVLISIENCCRTLEGTIDHLLDWTKINNFKRVSSKERRVIRADKGDPSGTPRLSIEEGMLSRISHVDISVLAEQVVESMFAGHSFQTMSVMRMVENKQSEDTAAESIRTLDSMQAIESMSSQAGKFGDIRISLGGLVVTLLVGADLPWRFVAQPGAIRRIIMNLLGNALKFTTHGFVELRLGQETSPGLGSNLHLVTFTVSDSGRGIGQEFLRHQLFKPFAQEDSLAAGAGLGLSLVKKIVSSLGGSVHAESKVGVGSTMKVKLPLQVVSPSTQDCTVPQDEDDEEFRARVAELQGLRISIIGYPSASDGEPQSVAKTALMNEHSILVDVCTNWLRMQYIEPHESALLLPDLILRGDRSLDRITHGDRGDLSTPTVIVCRSALVARQLATTPRYTIRSGAGVLEFISQPLGPRKLAKMLLYSFRRWTKLQEAAMSTQAPSDYTQTNIDISSPMENRGADSIDHMTSQYSDLGVPSHTPPHSETISPIEKTSEDNVAPDRSATVTPRAEGREVAKPSGDEHSRSPKRKDRLARYLLVDDNVINLKILAAYMRKLGHAYDTAADGLEALQTFQKGSGQYRCVFIDISMPVMDGFESARRIRAFEGENKLRRCQIYALTGLASAGAQQEAFSSGIDLFLAKPVKLKELSQILDARHQDKDRASE